MSEKHLPNIETLNSYMKDSENVVHYAGISSKDDFKNFESLIQFKFKFVCQDRQLTKICKFINAYKSEFDYDWYIKIRPDIKLLQQVNFSILNCDAINARAREYEGPQSIPNATSVPVDLKSNWVTPKTFLFNEIEKKVVLDDQFYIFHHNLIPKFHCDIPRSMEIEWDHADHWKRLQIASNVIGIKLIFTSNNWISGDLVPNKAK